MSFEPISLGEFAAMVAPKLKELSDKEQEAVNLFEIFQKCDIEDGQIDDELTPEQIEKASVLVDKKIEELRAQKQASEKPSFGLNGNNSKAKAVILNDGIMVYMKDEKYYSDSECKTFLGNNRDVAYEEAYNLRLKHSDEVLANPQSGLEDKMKALENKIDDMIRKGGYDKINWRGFGDISDKTADECYDALVSKTQGWSELDREAKEKLFSDFDSNLRPLIAYYREVSDEYFKDWE
jgi:hypothetical protein